MSFEFRVYAANAGKSLLKQGLKTLPKFSFASIDSAVFDIIAPEFFQIFYFIRRQFPFHFRRTSHDERTGGNFRVRRNERTGGDKRIFADSCAI